MKQKAKEVFWGGSPPSPRSSNELPRYSHRLSSRSFSQNVLSRLLVERRRLAAPILDLTGSNPTVLPEYPQRAFGEIFGQISDARYRPDPFGLLDARQAVQEFYREHGIAVETSSIALTASTSEAYSLLFKLLCDPGDDVLVPVPSYPLFEYLAGFENLRTVPYQLRYDGSWFLDLAHLREQLTPRTRAVVIVNPNNPTGSFLKKAEHESLIALSSETGIPLIADEVFMNYEFGADPARSRTLIDDHRALSFSLNGLSKVAGMPQMKLAWIVVNGPVSERQDAWEQLEILLDTYLSVNTPVQLCARQLFGVGTDIRNQLLTNARNNLEFAREALVGSPLHVLHVEGGWSVILQLPRTRGEEQWLLALLREQDVLLQPGYFFDMPSEAYAVASLITEPAIFQQGIRRTRDFVSAAAG